MKTERKRKTLTAVQRKGAAKSCTSHSNFSEFDPVLSNESIYKMPQDIFNDIKPNTSASVGEPKNLKSTVSSPVVRRSVQSVTGRTVTSTIESFQALEKDEPVYKHHLEQVFMPQPLSR